MRPTESNSRERARVRIPADFEREDKLLGNLSARQLAILGVAAVVLWGAYSATRPLVPIAAFGALAAPFAGAATLLALGRVGGEPAHRLARAAWRHLRSPRRLVPAPDGVPPMPSFVGIEPGPSPHPLQLPMTDVSDDGVVDLGADGVALICRASAVTFSLRTPAEQEALVAGFARYLNSLADPIEILIRAEPVDLAPMIADLQAAAPGMAHPGLESAARGHARFLEELAERRDLLRREVLVVLRQPGDAHQPGRQNQSEGDGRTGRLRRRADEAAVALAGAGVTLTGLDGPGAVGSITRALDPFGDPYPPTVFAVAPVTAIHSIRGSSDGASSDGDSSDSASSDRALSDGDSSAPSSGHNSAATNTSSSTAHPTTGAGA